MPRDLHLDPILRQMRDNNLTIRKDASAIPVGIPRKLCILSENGNRMRFPYHYLFSEKLVTNEDDHLLLEFMSDTVKIKGLNLHALFDYLGQEPPFLRVADSRYTAIANELPFLIQEVVIVKRDGEPT